MVHIHTITSMMYMRYYNLVGGICNRENTVQCISIKTITEPRGDYSWKIKEEKLSFSFNIIQQQ